MSQGKYRRPGGLAAGKFCPLKLKKWLRSSQSSCTSSQKLGREKTSQIRSKTAAPPLPRSCIPRRVKPEAVTDRNAGTEKFRGRLVEELVTDGSKCLDKFGEIFFTTDCSVVSDLDLITSGTAVMVTRCSKYPPFSE